MDEQELKRILSRAEPPEPDKAAQYQAIEAALDVFDKKTQGKRAGPRLTDSALFNSVRRIFMEKRYVLSGMAGAVSLVAVMAVIGPQWALRGAQVTAVRVDAKKEAAATYESALSSVAAPQVLAEQRMADAGAAGKVKRAYAPAEMKVAAGLASDMAAMPASAPVRQNMVMAREMDVISPMPAYKDEGRDKFTHEEENPVKVAAEEPVSTFSVDVDTASYAFMRRMINSGVLPQKDAVRPEEMINYFPYNYAVPETREEPFRPAVAVYDSPWKKGGKLIHIGIKGYDVAPAEKPRANLVFLVDVSGSMNSPDKLPLLRNSLKMLLDTLNAEDTVAIVTYAGRAGVALEPTPAKDREKIVAALEGLESGGSTAGAEGIRTAYQLAEAHKVEGGVNRVLLATDGDFNVGISSQDELKSFIEREREGGVTLSILGFGQGNYNDALMQTLAQNGNGNAAYIDTLSEARKVLVQESSSTLFTIAKDVKLQVEFNPAVVKEYRLVGYETRRLAREDFNNDKVDAGDIGAGHAVTAIYEITPVGTGAALNDDLRYADAKSAAPEAKGGEYAFLKIRYKLPNEDKSRLITRPVTHADDVELAKADDDTRFSTAVAGFAEMLKGGRYTGGYGYDDVIALAEGARGRDEFGYRNEFVNLVRLAKSASNMSAPQ